MKRIGNSKIYCMSFKNFFNRRTCQIKETKQKNQMNASCFKMLLFVEKQSSWAKSCDRMKKGAGKGLNWRNFKNFGTIYQQPVYFFFPLPGMAALSILDRKYLGFYFSIYNAASPLVDANY